jgi:hypothetical protein
MEVIGLVQECVGADAVEKGPCPGCATMHTVRILNRRTHIGLNTLNTGLFMTLAALSLCSNNGCIGLRANGTTRSLHNFILGLSLSLGLSGFYRDRLFHNKSCYRSFSLETLLNRSRIRHSTG